MCAQQLADPLGAELVPAATRLHQAVGEDAQHLAGRELDLGVVQLGVVEEPERGAERADLLDLAVRPQDQRPVVAREGEGDAQRASVVVAVAQVPVHERAVAFGLGLRLQHGVDLAQRRRGRQGRAGQGAQRVAGGRADGGRLGALAADVAEHEGPRLLVQREHVEEVAADLAAVARRDVRLASSQPGTSGSLGGTMLACRAEATREWSSRTCWRCCWSRTRSVISRSTTSTPAGGPRCR